MFHVKHFWFEIWVGHPSTSSGWADLIQTSPVLSLSKHLMPTMFHVKHFASANHL